MRYCASLRSAFEGDVEAAHAGFAEAAKIGDRFGDPELVALARVGEGRCLIYRGEIAEGMALLDEAMVAVTAHEVSPAAVGDLYCTVIEGCQEVFDVRRAQEWTAALSRWCDSQPELVLYRGQCLVHRAELMVFGGAWSDAVAEVQRACDRLARPASQPALGAAYYVRAELHRLRGEFAEAEVAYRKANQCGRQPQPGLAQLRLAQGRVDEAGGDDAPGPRRGRGRRDAVAGCWARTSRSSSPAATSPPHAAPPMSCPGSRPSGTRRCCPPCRRMRPGRSCWPRATPAAALAALRRAWAGWGELDAPYDAARSRVLIGLACRALGDEDSAQMELDAARSVFLQLDAAPDLVRVEELSPTTARPHRGRVDRPRGAGTEAGRDRHDQPGHRVRARHQREDGGHPRQQHLHQAGVVIPLGGDGLRLRTRSRVGRSLRRITYSRRRRFRLFARCGGRRRLPTVRRQRFRPRPSTAGPDG